VTFDQLAVETEGYTFLGFFWVKGYTFLGPGLLLSFFLFWLNLDYVDAGD